MPIKNLTENVRLPRLGKIRIGVKTPSAAGKSPYPTKTDYFVCPPDVYGALEIKPEDVKSLKALSIMFPTEDPEQWASQFYRCYSATRGLICKGDGEVASALVDTKTGEICNLKSEETVRREITCDPETCAMHTKGHCKPVMNLQFLLPDVPGLGIWQLDTGSINSIKNINSAVRMIQGLTGRISMIPLTLKLLPLEVSPDGKKKTVYVLHLTTEEKLASIMDRARLLTTGTLLPEPDIETPDDLFPDEVLMEQEIAEKGNKIPLTTGQIVDGDTGEIIEEEPPY